MLGDPSKPDYEFITGDGYLIESAISLDTDELGGSCQVKILDLNHSLANEYYTVIFEENGLEPPIIDFQRLEPNEENAINSVNSKYENVGETVNPNIKAGQQISIELGETGISYLRYEFINDSIDYDYKNRIIIFGGSVASKVMTQYSKNTAYENIDFRTLASEITSKYGLTLDIDNDGPNPTYEYIPQIGVSDYQFLLYEAKRLGYKVYTSSATLKLVTTKKIAERQLTAIYGDNLIDITFSYQVDPVGSESIRESAGNQDSSNVKKFEINEDGLLIPLRAENQTVDNDTVTTGSTIDDKKSIDDTGVSADSENEKRTKGIEANLELLFNPNTAKLDPFTALITDNLGETLSRVWVPDQVSFDYRNNQVRVFASAYSPLKPKYNEISPPPPVDNASVEGDDIPLNPNGKTVNQILIESYGKLGGFSSRSGPGGGNVACVWAINKLFTQGGISPLWGSALAVFQCRNAMKASQFGRQIRVGSELPGDMTMVLNSDGFAGHIGLVIGQGRTVSNSSSRAAFVWFSSLFFPESYGRAVIREVWRDLRTF